MKDLNVAWDTSVPDSNLRAPHYYIAQSRIRCWHCGAATEVVALALSEAHETWDAEADEPAAAWQRAGAHALIFYAAGLPDDVWRGMTALAPGFGLTYSEVTSTRYWANHCAHCQGLLEDHELHCEPDGAFAPSSDAAAARIRFTRIDRAFTADAAGYTLAPAFLDALSRT